MYDGQGLWISNTTLIQYLLLSYQNILNIFFDRQENYYKLFKYKHGINYC